MLDEMHVDIFALFVNFLGRISQTSDLRPQTSDTALLTVSSHSPTGPS